MLAVPAVAVALAVPDRRARAVAGTRAELDAGRPDRLAAELAARAVPDTVARALAVPAVELAGRTVARARPVAGTAVVVEREELPSRRLRSRERRR